MAVVALLAAVAVGCTAAPLPQVSAPTPATPPPPPIDPVEQYATDRLASMTLDQRIRSLFMLHLPGTSGADMAATIAVTGIGGVILMRDNVPDPDALLTQETAAMSPDPSLPVLIGIDQEGGVVSRIASDDFPGADVLRFQPPADARTAFAQRGALLAERGATINFGVVADVVADPSSFLYERTFGDTADTVSERVVAAVRGEEPHVLTTLKHFPGHGAAPGDSHLTVPVTGMSFAEWQSSHAPPFADGIAAGADLVMMGHLQYDAVDPQPASLSARWHSILRDDLGFDGLIVTDDLGMLSDSGRPEYADPAANAVATLAAGTTLVLFVHAVDLDAVVGAVTAAVADGTLSATAIDDAAHRLLVARRTLTGLTTPLRPCGDGCQSRIA